MTLRWEAAGATDTGRVRQANEDSFLAEPGAGVFLVADGMGGHAAGEVASALAAQTVGSALLAVAGPGAEAATVEAALRRSFATAHAAIVAHTDTDPHTRGMGTTLTACVADATGALRIGHIGDSRAYLRREGVLRQLTRDHTWVQDQVDAGRLDVREARTHRLAHVITRALGADSTDDPDFLDCDLRAGDLVLLCTDGLSGMVTDEEIAEILSHSLPVELAVDALLAAANEAGGNDNITAVLIRLHAGE